MTSRYSWSNSLMRRPLRSQRIGASLQTSARARPVRRENAVASAGSQKKLARACDARCEPVDLVRHGVEVEARTVRRRDTQLRHQRLAAVVARADRHCVEIEHLRHVVRVDALEVEADDAGAALGRRTVERDPRYLAELLERIPGQLLLVRVDRVEADLLQ